MTDPNILYTDGYKYIQAKFNKSIQQGPLFACNIFWKFEYKTNVVELNLDRYNDHNEVFNKCKTDKVSLDGTKYICKSCDRFLKRVICQHKHRITS